GKGAAGKGEWSEEGCGWRFELDRGRAGGGCGEWSPVAARAVGFPIGVSGGIQRSRTHVLSREHLLGDPSHLGRPKAAHRIWQRSAGAAVVDTERAHLGRLTAGQSGPRLENPAR